MADEDLPGQTPEGPPHPDATAAADLPDAMGNAAGFAADVLRALTNMAAHNRHREADLLAALRAARLPADPGRLRSALLLLRAQGCVSNFVAMSDGSLLLTVTGRAMERPEQASQWLPLD